MIGCRVYCGSTRFKSMSTETRYPSMCGTRHIVPASIHSWNVVKGILKSSATCAGSDEPLLSKDFCAARTESFKGTLCPFPNHALRIQLVCKTASFCVFVRRTEQRWKFWEPRAKPIGRWFPFTASLLAICWGSLCVMLVCEECLRLSQNWLRNHNNNKLLYTQICKHIYILYIYVLRANYGPVRLNYG